ncbi:MAG: hypothetical protein RQ826_04035 [Xanthomonadales bacterium]|nr:hypothetical protein [Xanthomonadales bacterium]
MHPICTKIIITLLTGIAGSSAALADLPAASSQPQFLRPFELGQERGQNTGRFSRNRQANPQGNVRQRTEYGKNFRYGRSVQGPQGDIIIWSPAPNNSYGKQPRPQVVLPPSQQPRGPGHRRQRD